MKALFAMGELVPARRSSHRLILVILCQSIFGWALVVGLVNPVLPEMARRLNTSSANITWVFTAYLLAAAVCTPVIGRVGDALGQRRILLITLSIFAVGCLAAAYATNLGEMVAARALQGAGGGLMPVGFAIMRDVMPRQKLAGAIGASAALAAAGSSAGLVLAGPVVDHLGYRWLFWLPGLITVAAMVSARLVLPEPAEHRPSRVNVPSAVLLSAWLIAFLLGVSEGNAWGWASVRTVTLFVVALAGAALWLASELRSSQPLIDMKLMRLRTVWACNVSAMLTGAGLYGTAASLPIFLQTPRSFGFGFGASVSQSSLLLLPQAGTMIATAACVGALTRRSSSRTLLIAGSAIQCCALVLLSGFHAYEWQVCIALGVSGAGNGLAFASTSAVIVGAVPASQTGAVSGMNANIRVIGGAIGSAVFAAIFAAHVVRDNLPSERAYTLGFSILAAAAALAAATAIAIPRAGDPGRDPAAALGDAVPILQPAVGAATPIPPPAVGDAGLVAQPVAET